MIWSPSIALAVLVDGEHPIAVAVEGDAEVVAAVPHRLLQQPEIGRAGTDVDVRAVRCVRDRMHLCTTELECMWRQP